MMVAPNAELDDGAFDVVAMGDFDVRRSADERAPALQGHAPRDGQGDACGARSVVEAEPIDPGAVVELDVDGEAPGRLPARFELVPARCGWSVPGTRG